LVTDEVIRWHLSGRDDVGQPFVAGVYPMLLDETCVFVAVDFDGHDESFGICGSRLRSAGRHFNALTTASHLHFS